MKPEWNNCFYSNMSWLVFRNQVDFPDTLRLDSHFYTIQQDKTHLNEIREWYRIHGDLFSNLIGSWKHNLGLYLTKESKWTRRMDFHGHTLMATTNIWNPISFQDKRHDKFTGLVPELVQTIGRAANFTVKWVVPADENYGSLLENGTWDGLVGMLHRDKADVAAAGLAVTFQRNNVVDFSVPYGESRSALIMLAPELVDSGLHINWTSFLSVFTESSWLLILSIFLMVFISCIIINSWLLPGQRTMTTKQCQKVMGYLMSFIIDMAFCFSRSLLTLSPSFLSHKILYVTINLTSMVLWAHYEGMLTSFMTIQPPATKIDSLSGILDSDYSIVLIPGTKQGDDLKNAPFGSAKRKLHETRIRGYPRYASDAAEVLLANPEFLLYASEFTLKNVPGLARFTNLDDAPLDYMALAFPKDSELLEFFNYNMIKLHHSGVLRFLTDKWLKNRAPSAICARQEESATPLGYSNLILPTLVFCAGALCAGLVSLIEAFSKLDWKISSNL